MKHNVVYVFVILVDDDYCVAIHDLSPVQCSQRCFPLNLGDLTIVITLKHILSALFSIFFLYVSIIFLLRLTFVYCTILIVYVCLFFLCKKITTPIKYILANYDFLRIIIINYNLFTAVICMLATSVVCRYRNIMTLT